MIELTRLVLLSLITSLIISGCQTKRNIEPGQELNFNQGWEFTLIEDSTHAFSENNLWDKIRLPHTPKLEPIVVNDQWQGICWYKKQFKTPGNSEVKKYFLKFDGAMMVAEVWVNGKLKIKHLGGYLPFTIDITEDLFNNEFNEVIVRLDNRDNPITGPKPLEILDFNTYGGLYRDVHLIEKNSVYITDPMAEGIPASGGIFVRFPQADSNIAKIKVSTHIRNSGIKKNKLKIIHELWWKDMLISIERQQSIGVPAGEAINVDALVEIDNPHLWSPEDPSLYKLVTSVVAGDDTLDQQLTPIGIKNIKFQNNQLYLNGTKRFLRGVNRHQEYPYIGYALSNEAQYRDAVKIKEAGFDYVRISHYPHAPAFMKACDEIGLLVIDAILGWQYYKEDVNFMDHVYQTARDLVRRDRNHACVLAWEVSLNESWMPEYFIDSLTSIAHQEYPGNQCYTAGWQEYGYDLFLQARQHRLKHYSTPTKPYVVSEYGDWEYYAQNAGLNQDSWDGLKEEERTSRQLLSSGEKRLLQQALNIQEAHNDNFNTPAFADGYWVMFDYNRGYADDLESSGIMSINRVPKFSYYFYRSQRDPEEHADLYSSGPMVYIASYWTDSSDTDIRIFSNCEEIELYLNDSLIGRQKPDQNLLTTSLSHPPFTFVLENFEPGTLVAKGFINGQEVCQHEHNTPGEVAGIIVWLDESGKKPQAGVNDLVFVHAALVDESGTIVPLNNVDVSFDTKDDASLLSPEIIKTEAGIATALVMIGDSPGDILLTCKSENIQEVFFTFQSK